MAHGFRRWWVTRNRSSAATFWALPTRVVQFEKSRFGASRVALYWFAGRHRLLGGPVDTQIQSEPCTESLSCWRFWESSRWSTLRPGRRRDFPLSIKLRLRRKVGKRLLSPMVSKRSHQRFGRIENRKPSRLKR